MRALLVAAALGLSAAHPATAAPLPPTGPWVVSQEAGVCLLQRNYGTAAQPLAVGFRQVPTIDEMQLLMVDGGPGLVGSRTIRVSGVKAALTSYRLSDGAKRASEAWIPRQAAEQAAATGSLSVDAGSALQFNVAVPAMKRALAELDACVAEQLAEWGVARDQQLVTARFPKPDKDALPNPGRDFIETYSVRGVLDNLAFVRVDAEGRASGCRLLQSSGHRDVDQASCDVLLAARFKPATDRAGQPLASVYAHAFRWNTSDYR